MAFDKGDIERQIKLVNHTNIKDKSTNIIKIMPCVGGNRSDCQPEANSIARSRRLRAMVVVKG